MPPAESKPETVPTPHTSQRLLKTERDPYRSVFDGNPVPMLVCEVGTLTVTAANLAAARLHGYSPAELEGRTLFELRRLSDLTSVMLKRAVGHEVALGFGYHSRKDGSLFPVHLSVHPSDFVGRPAWLCVLKSLEELLTPREGEQQRRLFEAVGRVAGGLAHDINNALSVIMSLGSLADSQLPPHSPVHADLSEIRHAAERASGITRQLLSLSRKGPAAPKPMQLNDVVARMEKVLLRLLDDQMSLELSLDPDAPQVLADSSQVERLLVQLVSEARAGGKPGLLRIETRSLALETERGSEPNVVLRVLDDSGSLTPEAAATVTLIDSGSSWLESEPGVGARFVACFPTVRGRPEPRGDAPTETVLVVQDNAHLRKTLRTYFARKGFRVLDADSSLEALRLVEQTPRVDLLLTDFALTDGNGPDLCRALREQLPSLRVLVALGNPAQRAMLRLDERTAAISKPFDLQEFGTLVQRLLEKPDLK